MAKYYVQSGTLQLVVEAEDARRAALWAVQRAMQQILPVFDDHRFSPQEKQRLAARRGLHLLGETLTVNQVGFSREGLQWDTFDVVGEWSQLMLALTRMEELGVVTTNEQPVSVGG